MFISAQHVFSNAYITPEDYGCVSDDIKYATNNSICFQKAINEACKSGKKLISQGSKKYYIDKGLIITSHFDIDLSNAILVPLDSVDVLSIDFDSKQQFSGNIRNVRIDLNNIGKSGIKVKWGGKLHISDCDIYNVPKRGSGIKLDVCYEVFVDNVHIKANQEGATGLEVHTSDCHFSDCVMIDCTTAIRNWGSNCFDRIHAWMTSRWVENSVFYESNTRGPVFMTQCCSDTYNTSFLVKKESIIFINQFKNFQNLQMWQKVKVPRPFVFKFENEELNSQIFFENSYVSSLMKDGVNCQQILSNKQSVIINNCVVD